MSPQDLVRQFHEKFGVPVADMPTLQNRALRELRLKLIWEEADELGTALDDEDLVGVADALGDLIYVVYGAALTFGIDMEPILQEIHRTNMLKAGGTTRADGKILKPEGWQPPQLEPILEAQGWKE